MLALPAPATVVETDAAEDLRPGRLGLILVADRHEVRRVGYAKPVIFGGNQRLWQIVERLYRRGTGYYPRSDLIAGIWGADDAEPEKSTVDAAISVVRRMLRPLEITIERTKGLGYRLVEQAAP